MTRRAVTPRAALMAAGIFACSLLAGCGFDPVNLVVNQKEVEEQTPYVAVPNQQAWVNPGAVTFVMQRGLLGGSEQRIGLRNALEIPGDNQMVLRSRAGNLAAARFRFEEFMTRVGGAPAPFEGITSGDLLTAEDEFGVYHWAEKNFGSDITCVFAVRRLTSAARDLPGEALVLDIMLRNCLRGSSAEALAPIAPESIGFSARAAAPVPHGTRLLSPLAAPGLD
ncbi:hypothetical protein [Pseudogemmobacter faecipullorum]|uniref:Lipoprotein n=1 Tax=Pseudogemmobacter faecipullorum TaxID=2755041 RepID=A0ABS8CNX8_9RHOB|nr:hypothetical protein [Pseudogemmobacter faecipullorum]MCB5411100.1 hypothetical protein [Pseudogemmobacter faecipullorum]